MKINHAAVQIIACTAVTISLCSFTAPAASAEVSGAERVLAGVKIFSRSGVVLQKYGTPDEIRVGSQSSSLLGDGEVHNAPGDNSSPNAPADAPSEFGGAPAPGSSATTGASTAYQTQTWVYDRPDGSSLEFTLSSDGRVIQIHATGYRSQSIKTARGVTLGMNLSEVEERYHFPQATNLTGKFLNLNYSQKYHCAFQFLNQKLVGIIVAAVD